ncbi:hypothetical protein SAMN04488696_2622 [Methanolobus profundi]|uniref:Uncharacterized protein n=1 Tax=Methanolobus profundi TaxID=487685 RepID=A0A1I4U880_9EURY|nr:hypothetical protein SAMN04488696_2622 [Methanolobus profundi]
MNRSPYTTAATIQDIISKESILVEHLSGTELMYEVKVWIQTGKRKS